jgi:hypothetical protein
MGAALLIVLLAAVGVVWVRHYWPRRETPRRPWLVADGEFSSPGDDDDEGNRQS